MGTFALVYCGAGAIIRNQANNGFVCPTGVAVPLAGRFIFKGILPYALSLISGLLASMLLQYLNPGNGKRSDSGT